jgi:magnesium-transporting ATPase (P-type)
MNQRAPAFWSISGTEILQRLGTTKEGLSGDESRQRLARYGSNLLKPQERSDVLTLLLAQFKSPVMVWLMNLRDLFVDEATLTQTARNRI